MDHAAENTTEATPTVADKEGALEWLRSTFDPSARQLWDVQGPRDTPGRLSGVLVKIDGQRCVVIVHTFDDPSDSWQIFGEAGDGNDRANARASLEALFSTDRD